MKLKTTLFIIGSAVAVLPAFGRDNGTQKQDVIPAYQSAAPNTRSDSPEFSELLAEARAEAVQLKSDSAEMESYTRSPGMNWRSYADKLVLIKEHVNAAAQLVNEMNDIKGLSRWQGIALERTTSALKEVAANVTSTIGQLDSSAHTVHMPAFQEYIKTNYKLVSKLEAVISVYVDYGYTKAKAERLEQSLEIGG
jgi:hypothetical protein